jgi:hypothetical protein
MKAAYPGLPGRGGTSLGSPPAKCGQLSATKSELAPQALRVKPRTHANDAATSRCTVIMAITPYARPFENRCGKPSFCSSHPVARCPAFRGGTVMRPRSGILGGPHQRLPKALPDYADQEALWFYGFGRIFSGKPVAAFPENALIGLTPPDAPQVHDPPP